MTIQSNHTDFIGIYDNVLPDQTCDDIVRLFEDAPGKTAGKTGGGVDTDKKNSLDVSFTNNPHFNACHKTVFQATADCMLKYLSEYFFAVIGPIGLTLRNPQTGQPEKVTHENFESLVKPQLPSIVNYLFRIGEINTQRYKANQGGYPYWHSEVYPQLPHNDALHRVLLFMFYLNDVPEGGETEFYYQKRKITPQKGRMVIAPGYFTHTHRGLVPVSNDKYILTSWILFNPAERIYTQS